MTTYLYEKEITSPISPTRLFKAYIDGANLLPKIVPQSIKSIEHLEGDGGPGTLYLVTFGEGSPVKSMKQRVDAIDKENFLYKYSILTHEGGSFSEFLESISVVIKMEPALDGGSVAKSSTTYRIKVEVPQDKINEVAQKATKNSENGETFYKGLEAYLLAHPDEYN